MTKALVGGGDKGGGSLTGDAPPTPPSMGQAVAQILRRDGYYRFPPGVSKYEKLLSVTEILSVISKPALYWWYGKTAAANVLEDPLTFDTAEKAASGVHAKRDKAADRGSLVHSLVESMNRGQQIETVVGPAAGYYEAFQKWHATEKPAPLFTEATVFSETWGYAGTTDLLATIGDMPTLVDFKTGKDIWPEAGLQLSAYKNATHLYLKDTQKAILMPAVEATKVVLLKPDGTYKTELTDAPLWAFNSAMALYRWWKNLA